MWYVNTYQIARDRISLSNSIDVRIWLIAKRVQDGHTYYLSSTSDVTAIIEGDTDNVVDEKCEFFLRRGLVA